jgi:hypothetical protein
MRIKALESQLKETKTENSEMRAMHEVGDLVSLYLRPFSALAKQKEGVQVGDYFEMWNGDGGFSARCVITKDVEARILSAYRMKLK